MALGTEWWWQIENDNGSFQPMDMARKLEALNGSVMVTCLNKKRIGEIIDAIQKVERHAQKKMEEAIRLGREVKNRNRVPLTQRSHFCLLSDFTLDVGGGIHGTKWIKGTREETDIRPPEEENLKNHKKTVKVF